MLDASRHDWRLFYWPLRFLRPAGLFVAASVAFAQGPTLTTISDTIYRADGAPASGTLLISWPPFTTAGGATVAAGNKSVTLGANGSFTAQLAPNAGATPAGTVYTVTYQLTDGTVKVETWSVGTTSPETISAVRTAAGTVTPAMQAATQQYVNAQLATVVHLSGAETVTGTKTFAVPPSLPTPSQAGDAVNKAYVDSAVGNLGSGNYVSKNGDTMTGPLTLPGDPAAPLQAADKHYVDLGTSSKADLVGGHVPTAELGTGTVNNGVCLHGDSTWGGCGTGNGPGLTAGMLAIKYATDFVWSQAPTNDLSTPGVHTVNLAQCPAGVTGTEPYYYVYISGTGTAEAALVTGGTCVGNGSPGTLQFTTANSHSAGYTIGSASGGLQEALIAARFSPSNPTGTSQSGKVIVPPGELKAYARVSVRASNITVDFSGSIVECWMNDSCLFLGDPSNSNLFEDITLVNPRGRATVSGGTAPFLEVHYRGQRGSALLMTSGRAFARVTNPGSIAALQRGIDNGVRSAVRHVKSPPARTSVDCENAALAILSDGATAGWTGKYKVWSDFLPGGAQDIFPGDGLNVNVPSCSANFQATVREVGITFTDLAGEHSLYEIQFADDAAKTLSFEFDSAKVTTPINIPQITNAQVGSTVLPDLTSAQITAVSSTTASIDSGIAPASGGGIEVRWSDSGWGQFNDENLAGRFTTQTFTLPRLAKVQDYFLRQYDASSPPRYSRHSAGLHLDYPY
jgi:hypothetical protein